MSGPKSSGKPWRARPVASAGPEVKVPGEPPRHDAQDPHLGADHKGPIHPLAVPQGVSTVAHSSIHKRAKRQRRPKSETLIISCTTGGPAWMHKFHPTTGYYENNAYNCMPVAAWNAASPFWDWTATAIPARWNGTGHVPGAEMHRLQGLADIDLQPPLVPKHTAATTTPAWMTNLQEPSYTLAGGRGSTTDSHHVWSVDQANRLPVNGTYYEETLVLQGKIVVPPGLSKINPSTGDSYPSHITFGNAKPWVRLIAIELLGEDLTGALLHSIPLSTFFPRVSTDATVRNEDPDYARRRNENEKADDALHQQAYKILIDQTWQLVDSTGHQVNEIPLKLKLRGSTIRDYHVTSADAADPPHSYPRDYGPSKEGRIIWQLFCNLGQSLDAPPGIPFVQCDAWPMWHGRWTLEIRDGNF